MLTDNNASADKIINESEALLMFLFVFIIFKITGTKVKPVVILNLGKNHHFHIFTLLISLLKLVTSIPR